MNRKHFIGSVGALVLGAVCHAETTIKGAKMYGLIGRFTAKSGQRDALIAALLDGVAGMPGCMSYVVAKDPTDLNRVWITEVWESKELHGASLALPSVQKAIATGKPLIESFGDSFVTEPVGGVGIKRGD